jgi:leucyl aminopeptidase (aminopeptidase T)
MDREQSEKIRPFKLDYDALAEVIVERAALQRNERVILVAKPGNFDSLTLLLKEKIAKRNATFLGAFSVTNEKPVAWQTKFTQSASAKSLNDLSQQFMSVDLGIMLPGADTTHVPYAAMQNVLRTGRGRTIHFHWAGAYRMDGTLLPRTQYVDELYQTALLETDYEDLSNRQLQLEDAARKNRIRVTTPLGTDIQFMIDGRPVTKQDGDASKTRSEVARNFIDREIELPAGAVRVAPLEESVEGKIAFPPMVWNGTTVNGLVMEFKSGKVINMFATDGLEEVKNELLKNGPSASSFREFAVGLNPWLAIPEIGPQWIPYYGYGAGVIRLSLGDNTELGGKISGGYVRWNFFTDATLQIGDETWIKDGRMVSGRHEGY